MRLRIQIALIVTITFLISSCSITKNSGFQISQDTRFSLAQPVSSVWDFYSETEFGRDSLASESAKSFVEQEFRSNKLINVDETIYPYAFLGKSLTTLDYAKEVAYLFSKAIDSKSLKDIVLPPNIAVMAERATNPYIIFTLHKGMNDYNFSMGWEAASYLFASFYYATVFYWFALGHGIDLDKRNDLAVMIVDTKSKTPVFFDIAYCEADPRDSKGIKILVNDILNRAIRRQR